MKATSPDPIVKEAVSLAEAWQKRANALMTAEEKGIAQQMERLVTHPEDKVVLTKLIDQSFRSENTARVANQVNSLLREYGVPDFFSSVEKLLAQMFMGLGRYIPSISVPKMIEKMRHDSSRAIIPGEPKALRAHLRMRKKQGVRMNINHLGEAILGETEALNRLKTYLESLKNPDIEYISVKISSIFSQIQPLAFEKTLGVLEERLLQLYRTAKDNVYERRDGTRVVKFVNLDMEEYRDMEITAAAFIRALEKEDLKDHSAGIVLQAYLPDAYDMQKALTEWARKRVAHGGAPIKIRIVKGANMEMEQLEAAIHNWPLAPYDNKRDVDANYKRMVEFGMRPENAGAVHLGIASHNLFELAYAFCLARQRGVTESFSFEMLKGMADHVRRAIEEVSGEVVVYAPVAAREQFLSAIGYLIRRLDENTAGENFLRHSFNLVPGSETWTFLKNQFAASLEHRDKAATAPNRTQNRSREKFPEKMGTFHEKEFNNEPDTDWALAANRKWAGMIREKWKKSAADEPLKIPLVVGGRQVFANRTLAECMDPSQLPETVCTAVHAEAADRDVERAVRTARDDPDGWRKKSPARRHEILSRAAMRIRRARGDLIGAAAADTGKIFVETDGEVSEAVDFAEYYPFSAKTFDDIENVRCRGKGVGLVVSPWNFPVAIPCGGIAAALAAGNTVVFKPASAAVLAAWHLCRCFWDAGVSKNVLQFLPCFGQSAGAKLANHPDVDFIILTGGTDTGMTILKQRPGVFLAAETGGKNATIVTAMADRDQAVKHVLHSAFSNAGQKCSATSLLILETEVYHDPSFKRQLVDAAASCPVGSAWDFENKIGPLIRPPGGDLERALTRLEPGESWALQPRNVRNNPHLWTPGIKWGVRPESITHLTEFFGPVLGVMHAENLEEAVELANRTGYGLTSGLESLDQREHRYWKDHIVAGNLYVNRGTTGAMVLRQPFGGVRRSSLGAGIKAGGPNYVAQFMDFEDVDFPTIGAIRKDSMLLRLVERWRRSPGRGGLVAFGDDIAKTIRAVKSYLYWAEQEFWAEKDYFHLRGQDNIVRYLPVGTVVVRVHPDDSLFEVLARIAAVRISGCGLIVSIASGVNSRIVEFLKSDPGREFTGKAALKMQSDEDLVRMIPDIDRIRYAAADRVPAKVFEAASQSGFYISRSPVLMEGRIELLQYYHEQSICSNYHRYGNLGERALIDP